MPDPFADFEGCPCEYEDDEFCSGLCDMVEVTGASDHEVE